MLKRLAGSISGLPLLAALALSLAGCSGGGDAPPDPPTVQIWVLPATLPAHTCYVKVRWHSEHATQVVSSNFSAATVSGERIVLMSIASNFAEAHFNIKVADAGGVAAEAVKVVPISNPEQANTPPFAALGTPVSGGTPGTVFHFDTSASWDCQDPASTLERRFDFDGDGTWDTGWATTPLVDHAYTVEEAHHGTAQPPDPLYQGHVIYRVVARAELRDSGGLTATAVEDLDLDVTEGNTQPVARFTVMDPNGTFPQGAVDASGSTDAEDPASALRVGWDWTNDGHMDTAWTTTKTATPPLYPGPGTYQIRLYVRDTGDLEATTFRDIHIP
jgi:hypothetical protein